MVIPRYDIKIPQGATWVMSITWSRNSVAVPLTGCSARMQVREKHSAAAVLLSLTSAASGGITLGPAAGEITLRAEAAQTALLPAPLRAVYDIEVEEPDGTVTRVLEGTVFVSPEVTR